MHTTILDLPSLARALGGEISGGQVLCPGPGHKIAADRSLAVRPKADAPDGFIVHSFAGDDPIRCRDYVRAKCGLSAFNGNGRARRTEAEVEAALKAAIMRQPAIGKSSRIVCTYPYTDENGALLYEVLRLEPKSFRQRRPDGNGGRIWNLEGVRRVPYRLQELLQFPDATVFVCEGEKDADRVASLGHCATTAASGKWTDDIVAFFKDRDIIILEDVDGPGHKKALKAAHALHGTAATVRIVLLPGLTGHPNNKDVSDWLDADPNRASKLVDVCFDVPIWHPGQENEAAEAPLVGHDEVAPITDTPTVRAKVSTKEEPPAPLDFIDLTAWEGQPVPQRRWVVLNRVPDEEVTLVSGEGAVGKSLIVKQLAVATVAAKDWLGIMPEPGPVIYVTAEEKVDELHYRLHHIVEHYGTRFSDLADLHIRSMKGEDAILAHPNRNGIIRPTLLFERLFQAVLTIKPCWVGLDPNANLFAGDENNRAHVMQFIALLTQIAIEGNTSLWNVNDRSPPWADRQSQFMLMPKVDLDPLHLAISAGCRST